MRWRAAVAGLCVAWMAAEAWAGETGLFVAVGYGGRRITSRDGLSWENDQRWSDEAKDNDDVLFDVAFGAGRFSWRGVTSDGTHWEHTALETPAARDIAYGAGHFVVVGPGGLIESSHDAQAWERHETDSTEDFSRVVWTGTRFLVSGGKMAWS